MFRVPKTSVASFSRWRDRFGRLDIFVSNARPELPTFYEPPLTLSLDSWRMALDSQATAFLVGAQEASHLTRAGGRILAITYARMGTPADIGHAVALLCSEQAGWITGQTIYADGGASLMDTIFPLEIQGVPRPARAGGAP